MSEFAFFRFLGYDMLTEEEKEEKEEIIELTEEVLDAKGIECDSRISKLSKEQLKDILENVRRKRRNKRKNLKVKNKENKEKENKEKENKEKENKEKEKIVAK
ncbi:MAG: hypothetical protein ACPKQO_04305, partial [Nitrososphaeraceae archaeon]